jgi:hypothetical protein
MNVLLMSSFRLMILKTQTQTKTNNFYVTSSNKQFNQYINFVKIDDRVITDKSPTAAGKKIFRATTVAINKKTELLKLNFYQSFFYYFPPC